MRRVFSWLALAGVTSGGLSAALAPTIYQTAPGQFEVAALDAAAARRVIATADEAWRILAAPLGLPTGFSSPIFVRLVPAGEWSRPVPFLTVAEAGGVVSIQIGGAETAPDTTLRRALAQGLLSRLAVSRRGYDERLSPPLWLEHGCVGWWRTRADAAQFDALQYATARMPPPTLSELLTWPRGGMEPQARVLGSVWLFEFLRAEGGRAGEWPAFLTRLLKGEEPLAALAAAYPGRFADARERELWWGTGWHSLRTARVLPSLEAPESRRQLEQLSRFVVLVDGRETAPPLEFILDHHAEPFLAEEIARRAQMLAALLPTLHPFYRNAGLSLAEVIGDPGMTAPKRAEALQAFVRDWAAARELETTVTAALDAWEQGPGSPAAARAAF